MTARDTNATVIITTDDNVQAIERTRQRFVDKKNNQKKEMKIAESSDDEEDEDGTTFYESLLNVVLISERVLYDTVLVDEVKIDEMFNRHRDRILPSISPSNVSVIIFTSGSTGTPKVTKSRLLPFIPSWPRHPPRFVLLIHEFFVLDFYDRVFRSHTHRFTHTSAGQFLSYHPTSCWASLKPRSTLTSSKLSFHSSTVHHSFKFHRTSRWT